MRRLVLLAALVLLMAASAAAKDPEHIDPATLAKPCSKKNPPPCATSAPKVLYSSDPEYTPKAREEKIQGRAVLYLVVGTDGRAHDIRVARSLDPGLDQKAIEAVRGWRFAPATNHGSPVPVAINIEVNFHLY